jgi:DNA topoisomerase-1
MSKNLVIVESPAKAKTIENYLGKDFKVLASVGHIIDLPEKKLGVDIENDFKPSYEVINGKEKVVSGLKKEAAAADCVYLASDPDREGEAIAWHIQEAIKAKSKKILRVQFNEITKQGVADAIAHPGVVDMNRVNAQQSRRILDRLVGYQVSPLLWKPLKYGLSAGRVQTVALRMIAERDDEIEKFISKEWWSLDADFTIYEGKKKKGILKAALDKKNGKKIELVSEKEADAVVKALNGVNYKIESVDKKPVKVAAPVPFITARLQQEAIRRFGFTARTVMSTAQQLYEGVAIGKEGHTGLITYMRTDSTRIAPEAVAAAADYVKKTYGADFLGSAKAAKKGKAVQDAHEAIRPTVAARTPESIKQYLTPQQYKLYKLIWERFIASQMADAVYEQTTVIISGGDYTFRASGRVLTFAGFTVLYTEAADEDAKEEDNPAFLNVTTDNTPEAKEFFKKQHFTQPPPRFTEASLVRALEQQGIGRPSTYASIISTIVDRQYVEIREKRIFPTELGRIVEKLLVQNFPQIFDLKFTASLEEQLDKIAEGEEGWLDVMNEFYKDFSGELTKAEKKFNADLHLNMACPQCGKPLQQKYGKNGPFIACTGYPDCSFTSDYERDEEGKVKLLERKQENTGFTCEKCGSELVIKRSRYGEILACSGYPDCKNIKNFIRLTDGTIRVLSTGEKLGECPSCKKGEIVLKSGRNGLFAACSRYPDCKFTANVEADEEGKLSVKKESIPTEMGTCEKCGKPMVVKRGPKGPFLACSGYPDCKNAKSMKAKGGAAAAKKEGGTAKKATPAKKSVAPKKAATTAKKPAATAKKPAAKKPAPKKK